MRLARPAKIAWRLVKLPVRGVDLRLEHVLFPWRARHSSSTSVLPLVYSNLPTK